MSILNMHKVVKETAAYVIANYSFPSAADFVRDFTSSEKIKNLNCRITESKINIEPGGILPPGIKLPFAAYDIDGKIKLFYTNLDRHLDMSAEKYEECRDVMNSLLKCLVSLKIADKLSVGINYRADCNTGCRRLSVLNTKINNETITDWDSNKGFNLIIPMYLSKYECMAAYSIMKIQGGREENSEVLKDYIYKISVNYNFDFKMDNADIRKRLEFLDRLIDNIPNLYENFCSKCREITEL